MERFGTTRRGRCAAAGAAVALSAAGLTACADIEDVPPMEVDQLQKMLIDDDALGVTGIRTDTDFAVENTELQPGMGFLPVMSTGNCEEAIKRGLDARVPVRAAASRVFSSDFNQIAAGIYTVDDSGNQDVGRIYSDILTYCTDPVLNEGTGTEYTVDQLTDAGPDVTGLLIESRSTWGDLTTTVVMHRQIGHHVVTVGSIGFAESTAADAFRAQEAKLEQGLEEAR